MAGTREKRQGIFRQSAMSRIANADDLDQYIKVTNPSAWAVLLAALLLVGGLIIWSATAVIPLTVRVTGVAQDGLVHCWVDEGTAERVREKGAKASVNNTKATSVEIESTPLSDAEIRASYGSDYLSSALTLSSWNYEIILKVDDVVTTQDSARLVPVEITVSEKHPLDLVFGNK